MPLISLPADKGIIPQERCPENQGRLTLYPIIRSFWSKLDPAKLPRQCTLILKGRWKVAATVPSPVAVIFTVL